MLSVVRWSPTHTSSLSSLGAGLFWAPTDLVMICAMGWFKSNIISCVLNTEENIKWEARRGSYSMNAIDIGDQINCIVSE